MKFVAAVMWCALLMNCAHAQRGGVVSGIGTVSCGKYLEDRRSKVAFDFAYAEWVKGYLSAYNLFSTQAPIKSFPSNETILAFVDSFCSGKPLDQVQGGAIALVAELGGWRAPHLSGKTE
jgi:hypothetical protein